MNESIEDLKKLELTWYQTKANNVATKEDLASAGQAYVDTLEVTNRELIDALTRLVDPELAREVQADRLRSDV